MFPRELGEWGAPAAAEAAASAAAREWRDHGWHVEAFVDTLGRPAFRDRILPSAGYRDASLLCTYGALELRADAPHRWATAAVTAEAAATNVTARHRPWMALRIGRWHSIRVVGTESASWLYVMR